MLGSCEREREREREKGEETEIQTDIQTDRQIYIYEDRHIDKAPKNEKMAAHSKCFTQLYHC